MSETDTTFNPFQFKPDISASSKKLYTHNLTKLNGGKAITNLNFLSKEDIEAKLTDLKPNTRRTYLIAIVSSLKDRPEAKYKKLYTKFYAQLNDLNKELKNNTEKTPKVKENWIEQQSVTDKQKSLEEILPKINGKKKLTEDEYNQLLQLVVVSLYTLQNPRRNKDYTDMLICRVLPTDTEYNYLDLTKMEWVFNNYKTKKTYSQKVVPIGDELKPILETYLRFHPQAKLIKKKKITENIPFLAYFDGKPLNTSTDMTRMLNKIFGKKIGCSMLRAINLTSKYGDTLEQLKADVADMGTSVDTATNNYIKQSD
jgi:integrase